MKKLDRLSILFAAVAAVAVAPQAVAQSQGQNRNFRTPSDSVNLDGTPVAAIVLPGSNQSSVTNNYYTTNNTNNYATSTPSPAPAPSYVYVDTSSPAPAPSPAVVQTPAPAPVQTPAPPAPAPSVPAPPAPAPAPVVTITTASPPPPAPAPWVSTSCGGAEGSCEYTLVTPTTGGYTTTPIDYFSGMPAAGNNGYAQADAYANQPAPAPAAPYVWWDQP